jgi:hypothetical protein
MDEHSQPSLHDKPARKAAPVPERPRTLSGVLGHLKHHWFEWIFVAGLGLCIALFAWLTDDKLGDLLAIAQRWDRPVPQESREPAKEPAKSTVIQQTDGIGSPAQNGNGNRVIITGAPPR